MPYQPSSGLQMVLSCIIGTVTYLPSTWSQLASFFSEIWNIVGNPAINLIQRHFPFWGRRECHCNEIWVRTFTPGLAFFLAAWQVAVFRPWSVISFKGWWTILKKIEKVEYVLRGTKTTFLGEKTVRTNKYILPRNFYSSRKVKNVWRAVPLGYFFLLFVTKILRLLKKKNISWKVLY